MSHVSNSISAMEKVISIIEEAKKSNIAAYQELISNIKTAAGNGNLEPENHHQLMSNWYNPKENLIY